jgi:hypothetical protein
MQYEREYDAFLGARNRCNTPSTTSYERYGGRGIKFLYKDFQEFFTDLGAKPSYEKHKNGMPLYSLDRKNTNGNYEKGNCRWATFEEQQDNRENVGRPRRLEADKLTEGKFDKIVTFSCTNKQAEQLRILASEKGMNTSEYMRFLISELST